MRPNRFKVDERGPSAHSRSHHKHGRGKSQHVPNYDTFSPMGEPAYHEEPPNSNSPTFYDCYDAKEEYEITELIQMMPTDPTFTQRLKDRIIQLVRMRDEGILGAFHAYRKDGDFDGFKMRIIHKVLTPTGSRDNRSQALGSSSSAATAGFAY